MNKADEFYQVLTDSENEPHILQSTRDKMIAEWVRGERDLIARAMRLLEAWEKSKELAFPSDIVNALIKAVQ